MPKYHRHRSLKIDRAKNRETKQSFDLKAVERLIEDKTTNLQEQIVVLQTNSMLTGVILSDISSSILLALSDQASTKARLEDFLQNMSAALEHLQEYQGAPPPTRTPDTRIVFENAASQILSTLFNLDEGGTLEEIDYEAEDMIANVSEATDSPRRTPRPHRR